MARTPQTQQTGTDANPSVAYSLKAERLCREQRLSLAKQFMRVSPDVTGADKALADRVMDAVQRGDGERMDEALARKDVNELYRRGVLLIGGG